MKRIQGLFILDHPLAGGLLADMRDRRAGRAVVRDRVRRLAMLLTAEATRDLPVRPVRVRTPLGSASGARVKTSVGLVPVLRAGLGMVEGALDLLPEARVFHLGLFRDERTLEAVEYYNKLAHHRPVAVAYVLDPMLATGGSASAAVARLKEWGVSRVKFVGIFASPEGVCRLRSEHPDVPIHIAALDRCLDRKGYILPGCGDAGDRQFSGGPRA